MYFVRNKVTSTNALLLSNITIYQWLCLSYRGLCNTGYPSERHLKPNLLKSRLSISYFSVVKSFCDFVLSTTVSLQCVVQNVKTIGQITRLLWTKTNKISRDLSLIWVSDILYCTRPHAKKNGNVIYSFDQLFYIACRKTCLKFIMWDFQTNFEDWYSNTSWETEKMLLFLFKIGQYWQWMAWFRQQQMLSKMSNIMTSVYHSIWSVMFYVFFVYPEYLTAWNILFYSWSYRIDVQTGRLIIRDRIG